MVAIDPQGLRLALPHFVVNDRVSTGLPCGRGLGELVLVNMPSCSSLGMFHVAMRSSCCD